MSKRKRILASVSTVALIISMLSTGCSNTNSEENNASGTEENAPMKLTMMMDEATADYATLDAPIVQELEKRFNVEFEFEFYASAGNGFPEWISTRIVADEFPDYFFNSTQGAAAYRDFVSQGLLAELPMEKIQELCPDLVEWADKYTEYSGGIPIWDYFYIDDKIYALPYAWYDGAKRNVMGFREDWLEAVGIDKVPSTIEEYEEALKRFTENDPDGNGVDDTYGYSHISDPIFGFNWVYVAYGTNPNNFMVKEDGTVTRGEIEPGTKEALATLNKWYTAGYIDPEWIVNGWEEVQNKVIAEKCGLTWQGYPAFCDWDGWFLFKLLEVNENARWAISPGPVGPNGDFGMSQNNPVNGGGMYFSADLPEEKLDKYLEIINALSFDPELQLLLHKGVEGETYEVTENGYEWIPPYDDLQTRQEAGYDHTDNLGIYNMTAGGCFRDPSIQNSIFYTKEQQEKKAEMESIAAGPFDPLSPFVFDAATEHGETLSRLTTEAFTQFITGERSLDTFDAYVEEWLAAGGQDLIDEATAKYNEIFGS